MSPPDEPTLAADMAALLATILARPGMHLPQFGDPDLDEFDKLMLGPGRCVLIEWTRERADADRRRERQS